MLPWLVNAAGARLLEEHRKSAMESPCAATAPRQCLSIRNLPRRGQKSKSFRKKIQKAVSARRLMYSCWSKALATVRLPRTLLIRMRICRELRLCLDDFFRSHHLARLRKCPGLYREHHRRKHRCGTALPSRPPSILSQRPALSPWWHEDIVPTRLPGTCGSARLAWRLCASQASAVSVQVGNRSN